jgi:hypothetical protein
MSDSELDRFYRRASAEDPARPSEAVREAVLQRAGQLAARTPTESVATDSANAVRPRVARWLDAWRGLRWQLTAPIAAGVLIALLLAPEWRSRTPMPTQAPSAQPQALNAPAGMPAAPEPVARVAPPAPAPAAAPAESAASDLAEVQAGAAAARPQAQSAASAAADARASARESENAAKASSALESETLQGAAVRGDLVQARALLRNGSVDINSRDRNGRTALMLAVLYRHDALVRELLERGADPNSADAQGRTPLSVAQEQNQRGMAELLRQAGAH